MYRIVIHIELVSNGFIVIVRDRDDDLISKHVAKDKWEIDAIIRNMVTELEASRAEAIDHIVGDTTRQHEE